LLRFSDPLSILSWSCFIEEDDPLEILAGLSGHRRQAESFKKIETPR
jgi:hypothetical protein